MKKLLVKFKAWMTFYEPMVQTSEGWDLYRKQFKKTAPVRFFITSAYSTVTDCISERCRMVSCWYKYRFVKAHKYNTVYTRLSPGYYDVETRMLYSLFSMLEDFVECEMAMMDFHNTDLVDDVPFYTKLYNYVERRVVSFRLNNHVSYRKPDWGITYLEWETTLTDGNGDPSDQAKSAKETLELYLWWKERDLLHECDYPEMPDVDATKEVKEEYNAKLTEFYDKEMNNAKEDSEMILRLVKHRTNLWS